MTVTRKALGRADLAATTNTSVYTGSSAASQTIATVSFCNRNATAVTVRLALSDTGTPTAADWMEYDTLLPANRVLERTGICVDGTKRLVAYASGTGVSCVITGSEQT